MKITNYFVFYIFYFLFNCSTEAKNPVIQNEIHTGWEFRQAGKEVWHKATVPGCVHTDLMASEQIDDPYYRLNEQELQWIGEADWEYRTMFRAEEDQLAKQNMELVFKGLDTYTDVILNDTLILQTDNMFREWRVDVKPFLHPGENRLMIGFRSVFGENLPKWEKAPYRLMAYDNNDQADVKINMYSRKAGYHFGWDWGPRLITCGIWRPVYLEAWDGVRIRDLHIIQKQAGTESAVLQAIVDLDADMQGEVKVAIRYGNDIMASEQVFAKPGINSTTLQFSVENPRLWWTNGLGEPYLYSFTAEITDARGNTDEQSVNFGIRTLRVVREENEQGRSLYIELNGVPVFMKGANYIPQDNFQNRVTPDRYEYMIRSAAEANMNMLRVWGGGIYENDLFYDLCDAYGILIWQDFMFACGMYPADAACLDNVREEIQQNVRRLRNHPCIALYCGNNENEISWYGWGWKSNYTAAEQEQYEKDMKKLFHQVIPDAVKEVDPDRYYHITSPNTGYNNIGYNMGDVHYWGVWHGKEPFSYFEKNTGRFVSEYGFQSFPEMSTIKTFTEPDDRFLDSEVMLSHQRCMSDGRNDKQYGNRLIKTYMERHFRTPKDFESFVYVSQLLQAKGVELAIESHRLKMPYCMGSMYWQIDDCWPVASWSSIDYYGEWKALHYRAKQVYGDVIIVTREEERKITIHMISDRLEPVDGVVTTELIGFDGTVYWNHQQKLTVEPNCSKLYLEIPKERFPTGFIPEEAVLACRFTEAVNSNEQHAAISVHDVEKLHYFVPDKDLMLPEVTINIAMEPVDEGFRLKLGSDKLAKNVYLSVGDGQACFSDNYFDLLPGRKRDVIVEFGGSASELESALKIMTLRDTY